MIVIIRTCKVCGYKSRTYNGLGIHISKEHNLKVRDYYIKYRAKDTEGMCARKGCSNETHFLGLERGFIKHCSRTCGTLNSKVKDVWREKVREAWSSKSKSEIKKIKDGQRRTLERRLGPNYQEKLTKARIKGMKKRYGVSNPSYLDEVHEKRRLKRESRSKEFKAKSRAKTKATFLAKYGVEHIMHLDKVRAEIIRKGRAARVKMGYQVKDQKAFSKYRNKVHSLTSRFGKNDLPKKLLSKRGKCGVKGALQIDHVFGIKEGFEHKIPPEVIAHPANLQLVSWEDNLEKRWTVVMTKKQLYKRIRVYEKNRAA